VPKELALPSVWYEAAEIQICGQIFRVINALQEETPADDPTQLTVDYRRINRL